MRRRRKTGWQSWVGVTTALAVGLAVYVVMHRRGHEPVRAHVPKLCPISQPIPGIDVSYYQGDISWPRVQRAGVKFAFIRAADGVDIIDTKFEANWKNAHAAGIPRGAYQYFRADESPIDQADVVIALLRAHGTGELPPVIDVEDTAGLPLATVAANAKIWIDHVRSELKIEPLVYTNPGLWISRGAPELGSQVLWLAHYTQTCPTIPSPWVRWRIWQYTDTGRLDGIDGFVDLDVLDGTTSHF